MKETATLRRDKTGNSLNSHLKLSCYRSVAFSYAYCSHCLQDLDESSFRLSDREFDVEGGALPYLTFHGHRSLVPVHDAVHGG